MPRPGLPGDCACFRKVRRVAGGAGHRLERNVAGSGRLDHKSTCLSSKLTDALCPLQANFCSYFVQYLHSLSGLSLPIGDFLRLRSICAVVWAVHFQASQNQITLSELEAAFTGYVHTRATGPEGGELSRDCTDRE